MSEPTRIQLSKRPFVFGLNLLFFPNKPILYFDTEFLYYESRKEKGKYPIGSIVNIANTWIKINRQVVWELTGNHEGRTYRFTFITKSSFGFDPLETLKALLKK